MSLKSGVIRGFVKPSGYIYASDDQHYYFNVDQVKGAIENHQTVKFSINNDISRININTRYIIYLSTRAGLNK